MLDGEAREGPEDSVAPAVPPVAEVPRVASDPAYDSEDGSRCHSGHSQEHTVGGDCAASGSELSTCIFSTPKIVAEEVDDAREPAAVPSLALGSARLGPSDDSATASSACPPPEGRRRTPQGCLCLRDLRLLMQRQAQGQPTADSSSSACSGEPSTADSLHAVQQLLASSEAHLAEGCRAVAESREVAAWESQAAQDLRQELEGARRDLELRAQQAAASDDEIARLRAELAAAKSELEDQKKQAVTLLDTRTHESALRAEVAARAHESALRAELTAAQRSEKAESAQALLAEVAKEHAGTQLEILRVQAHAAQADLLRLKAELSESNNKQAVLEEELRFLRTQPQQALAKKGSVQGGPSLLTRHELASRSVERKVTKQGSNTRTLGDWLSCCSSVEKGQPVRKKLSTGNAA